MTLRPLLRRLARSDRGVALVEFAFVLPLLMILFATIIEGGRMMWSYQTAIAGVRDAARYLGRIVPTNVCPSSLPGTGAYDARLATIVRDSITGSSVLPADVQLDPSVASPVTASFACVTGTYRLDSTPVATVTARVRINFPFEGLFEFAADGIDPFIVTPITDQSRVFGS
jgi:hypothetical protein